MLKGVVHADKGIFALLGLSQPLPIMPFPRAVVLLSCLSTPRQLFCFVMTIV